MATRAEQRDRTRRTLVQEGRRLFAERGYAEVGLAEIVRAAGVTKGALYHQFDGKEALFRSVLEELQHEVGDAVAAAAEAHDDPWTQLTAGCEAFLVASGGPGVRRILLVDGPAVVGWSAWRALDEAGSGHHLVGALGVLVARGTLPPQPVEPLARLLSGAMNEAALWLAGSEGPDDLADTRAALLRLLEGLRADQSSSRPAPGPPD